MTRLKEDDIEQISATLSDYDQELLAKTGCRLRELAAYSVGKDINRPDDEFLQTAVIPLTCGQGVIGGFAESVASIINHLGFGAWVTDLPDAGGVAEAVKNGADILFMADDQRFMAMNLHTRAVSENGAATGKGYAAGLERMNNGLKGNEVLVLGVGPVGTSAAFFLARYGAKVSIFDPDLRASRTLVKEFAKFGYSLNIVGDLNLALRHHRLIVDACPAQNVIRQDHLREDTLIAAPGIPLGLEAAGLEQISSRLLHDPLQIGVAVMMFEVL
ncbi:3-methylornithyl-N6-L-lysine dehydrogenase PylD [Desulfosporosinus sp. PR]|uniref:3-methylornithyl-N6-L-lysine dehydrogenase PylD n=1 Tax=Candidatus Desulfosporosinus nitrosoreducens TaxID=3401928 RepID=UPI0027EC06AD|nr:3-methylornithyl-N6-L-lysine dehydrogenase PylD [Desulfosporosinus sp. PR]MDQ7093514.1 3-methylornithyl-N6-L-lysine dehydrogenase PylD [Desulfosporosinus sp. PR]